MLAGASGCMCALAWAPLTGAGRVGEATPEGGLCRAACLAVTLLGVRSCSVKDSPARQHIAALHLPLPAWGQGAGDDAGPKGTESLQNAPGDSITGQASCAGAR